MFPNRKDCNRNVFVRRTIQIMIEYYKIEYLKMKIIQSMLPLTVSLQHLKLPLLLFTFYHIFDLKDWKRFLNCYTKRKIMQNLSKILVIP